MVEFKFLKAVLDFLCMVKGLSSSCAKRNPMNGYFFDCKNDYRIYKQHSNVHDSVDARPHISVWIYEVPSTKAILVTVVFCVEDPFLISKLNNPALHGESYSNDTRMHYKLKFQPDIDTNSKTYISDIITLVLNLYVVVKNYM